MIMNLGNVHIPSGLFVSKLIHLLVDDAMCRSCAIRNKNFLACWPCMTKWIEWIEWIFRKNMRFKYCDREERRRFFSIFAMILYHSENVHWFIRLCRIGKIPKYWTERENHTLTYTILDKCARWKPINSLNTDFEHDWAQMINKIDRQ